MNAGDTFRRQHGEHLRVIISDPEVDPGSVLAVSFTTVRNRPWEDTTCILRPGDHPFIKKRSLVSYADATLHTNAELEAEPAAGRIQVLDPVSDELLARIHEGAKNSPRMRFGYQQLLEQQGLIQLD